MDFAGPLRAMYPNPDGYICTVGGEACPLTRVSIRSMNFGQQWRTEGITDVSYEIQLPVAFFLDLLRRDLPEYNDDCRRYPDPNSEIDRMLRGAGWPSAEDVLSNPELAQFMADWCAHDLLLHWLGDGPPDEEPGYVLNTIESVRVAEVFTIRGRGRRSGIPVRYQDV